MYKTASSELGQDWEIRKGSEIVQVHYLIGNLDYAS